MKFVPDMRLLFFCFWLLGGLLTGVSAAPPALIVILLPGSLNDWQSADAPHLHSLMRTGAVAMMNTRTAHRAGREERESPQSALLTLGAGSRAAGTGSASDFLLVQAKSPGTAMSAGALFERRTSLTPRIGQSVCVGWPAVVKANTDLGYDLHLGSLADMLTAHGFRVTAGGGPNADWVAASSSGVVQHVTQLQAAPGLCLIWDAGANIAAADALLGSAAAQAAALDSRLVVIAPYALDADYARNERLTPVLLWGQGVPAGLLTSQSTRRPGLVTNTDFAPSIASEFGIARSEFHPLPFGFGWSAQASSGGILEAAQVSRSAVQQAQGMRLLPYLAVVLGLYLLVVTAGNKRGLLPDALSVVPLAALTAALLAVSTLSFWILLPGLLGPSIVLTRITGSSRASALLAAGVLLTQTGDLLIGSPLMQRSLLGHSPIEGARYYGIGNEAMGLLLGAALTVAAQFWASGKTAQFSLVVLMGAVVLLLGSAGAKAGGVLVSVAVFGTFLFAVSGRRLTGRIAALLGAAVLGGIMLAALSNAFLMPAQTHSHIGEAVRRIASGGPSEAEDIIRRKLAVESRLAYHSAWAVLLWSGVFCTAVLWKRTPLLKTQTALRSAGMVGVLTCLLLNDAGVVAAAIFTAVLWGEAAKIPAQKVL